jgi:hypothetical protein
MLCVLVDQPAGPRRNVTTGSAYGLAPPSSGSRCEAPMPIALIRVDRAPRLPIPQPVGTSMPLIAAQYERNVNVYTGESLVNTYVLSDAWRRQNSQLRSARLMRSQSGVARSRALRIVPSVSDH